MTQSTQFDPRAWVFADENTTNQMPQNQQANAPQQPVLDPQEWVFGGKPSALPANFDPQEWVFRNVQDKDVTGMGTKYGEYFNSQVAKQRAAQQGRLDPVWIDNQFQHHLGEMEKFYTLQGFSPAQIEKIKAEFNQASNLAEQGAWYEKAWDHASDLAKSTAAATSGLTADVIGAFAPESEWHRDWKETRDAYANALSDRGLIGLNRQDQEFAQRMANGENEALAKLQSLWNHPLATANQATQVIPQVALAAATGGLSLGAVNAAASAGSYREEIRNAWKNLSPEQAMQMPQIQQRMAQGMTLEQAIEDASTDLSDNLAGIGRAAAIGGIDAISPLGKLGKGVNSGMLKTFGKEVTKEAAQEAIEQGNRNYGVGQIDGKTQLMDNVQANAVAGAVLGVPTGAISAYDAYRNDSQAKRQSEAVQNAVEVESENAAPTPNQTEKAAQQFDENVLDETLSVIEDEQRRKDYKEELENDIKDGLIAERAKENSTYGKLAKAYLQATNPQQEVEPEQVATSQPEAQAETEGLTQEQLDKQRAADLRSRMERWLNEEKVDDISDVISTPMTFTDDKAKVTFATRTAFGEIQRLAERNGIDPNDGNAIPTEHQSYAARNDAGALDTDTVQQTTTQSNNQSHSDSVNIEQDRQFLQNTLGDFASQIELVSRADLQGHKQSAEGFFENGKAHLVTDNIKGDDVFSREERLAWVAWHELGHNGVNVRFSANHKNLMEFARTNPVVNTLRRKIQQRYADMNIHINDDVATEEAIVELYAASQTNDWAKLEQDYNLRVHHSWKTGENSVRTFIENVVNKLRKIVGAVLKKDLSKATTTDILSLLKQLNQDPHTENVSPETEQDTRYSLNESADSDFAKAVDAVAQGGFSQQPIIDVGTTPDVLKMLGLPDVNVTISGAVLRKVMQEKHNVTPETLKQLPKQINDPVAVMKSSTKENGYVVLTELTENVDGINKPIVAALHLKQTQQGLELINIASVYGRNNSQIQRGLENDLLYWNKEKGAKFLDNLTLQLRSPLSENSSIQGSQLSNVHWLQLPLKLRSNANLSASNVKTEADLRQYQNNKETRFSQRENQDLSEQRYNQAKENGETELTYSQWKQVRSPAFKAWFGDWENDPGNASKVINPKTGEPLVVYHGTSANFNAFDPEKQKNYRNQYGGGFYFTSNPDVAKLFGDNVMPVFLNARIGLAEKRLARRKGQTVERDHLRPNDSRDIWVVYNPNQVKSATTNNGEFSAENDDIRYSLRPTNRPKSESLEKLRQAKPIHISGKDIEPSSDLRQYKRNALNYGKTLRGSYVNKDTGQEIKLGRAAIQEVLRHDYKDPDHLQSIAAIPQIIEKAIYVDTLPNEDKAKHPDISSYDYYLAGLNIGGDDYTVRAVIANSTTGEKYYDHKLSEIEKGDLLEMTSRVSTAEISNQSPIDLDDKRLLQILQDKSAVENEENIRYSNRQSVDDLVKTGKAKAEPGLFDDLKAKDWEGFKKRINRATSKLDEWFADSLRPVNDWIDEIKGIVPEHIAEQLKGDMYRAKGVRDALNSELEQAYLKPLLRKLAEIASKEGPSGNKSNELDVKRLVGFWLSARYSIERNQRYLADEKKAMEDAEEALHEAEAQDDPDLLDKARDAYRKAERQYRYRKADVESTNFGRNVEKNFKVGTAGGFSIPHARALMKRIETYVSRKDLESVAELVYDLNQARLLIDLNSGRFTQEAYDEYKQDRHYVPLTGDPRADEGFDFIGGAGQNALNIAKDKAHKGRKTSEAEDAIDATWKAVGKTTAYAGMADFKNRLDEIYENEFHRLREEGFSERSAKEQVEETLGISKKKMQGTTRTSDNVLIRKQGHSYYEYHLPNDVIQALKRDNVEQVNALLRLVSKPTGWYARGVTQWTLTFSPQNMLRDTWEKSEFIRVQKLYRNGKKVDDATMDKIGRGLLKYALSDKGLWTATKRFGFGQALREDVEDERLLKRLLELGGVSTYSTYLARTEKDLVKKVKAENSGLGKRLEQVGSILEGYNKTFDTVSSLAAFKSLIKNGIDEKQAAAITLELTNFRKQGSAMAPIKALYMFSQPTAMGARNLYKFLSHPKGRKRFFAYMAVMMPFYLALRAFDDEDEGGNKMDQLGDISRYIPIPAGLGKYIKLPVGFGMPQMAWNFSVNLVKAFVGDISNGEAAVNMLVHTMKTFAPISPSEISAAKYPIEKVAMTATPTILQPLMQIALNRNAFGSQITTNFVRDDKLKAEQAKSTTAQFWKDVALQVHDVFGIDAHPEQIKNLFDGYGSIFGSLKEVQTIFVENPNRELLGRNKRTPFFNQLYGAGNEFSIMSRYYEASDEAQSLFKEYESRKARGKLDGWLTPQKRAMIQFHQIDKKRMAELRAEKSKLTRDLNKGKLTPAGYEARLKLYNQKTDKLQRILLKRWREMNGLNTH
ncbi:LPD38 domain-containing protein [Avibacterium avium]|uniref:MuF-C-terminal domain-containing protein n=1 Tax=Avibacterium avium TaxID=751 RepID=UPI003BF82045